MTTTTFNSVSYVDRLSKLRLRIRDHFERIYANNEAQNELFASCILSRVCFL